MLLSVVSTATAILSDVELKLSPNLLINCGVTWHLAEPDKMYSGEVINQS